MLKKLTSRFLFGLVFSCLSSTPSLAALPTEPVEHKVLTDQSIESSVSIRELGISDGLRLQGAEASKTLYLPTSLLQRPQTLQLQLQSAPAMPTSKLWVESGHQVIAEDVLPRESQSIWSIPLTGLRPVNGQIPLRIHLSVDNPNVCQALTENWVIVTPESRVIYQASSSTSLPDINRFFPGYLRSVYVLMPARITSSEAQALLSLAGFLARTYPNIPHVALVTTLPDNLNPLDSRVIVFGGKQLQVRSLSAAKNSPPILALELGQHPKAAADALFLQDRFLESMAVDSASDISVQLESPEAVTGDQMTFARLGYPNEEVQGIGTQTVTYHFSQADMGEPIHNLTLRFAGVLSQLPSKSSGYISVSFNGDTIYTQPINSTRYDFYTSVKNSLLRRDNTVQISFTIMPGGGKCQLGTLPFLGTVDNASYLQFQKGESLPPGFDRFPTAFTEQMPVFLQRLQADDILQAMDLIMAMQKTTKWPLRPVFVQQLPKSGPLLYVGSDAPASAFLKITPFVLLDSRGKAILQYSPGSTFAALQAYGKVLALAGPSSLRAELVQGLLRGAGWYGVHGDVVLQSPSAAPIQVRMQEKALRVEPLPVRPLVFWEEYRDWFIVALGVFLLAVIVWLYPKLVRKGEPRGG